MGIDYACHMQNSPLAGDTDMVIKEYITGRVRSGATICFFASPSLLFRKGMKSLWVHSLAGRLERVVDFRN